MTKKIVNEQGCCRLITYQIIEVCAISLCCQANKLTSTIRPPDLVYCAVCGVTSARWWALPGHWAGPSLCVVGAQLPTSPLLLTLVSLLSVASLDSGFACSLPPWRDNKPSWCLLVEMDLSKIHSSRPHGKSLTKKGTSGLVNQSSQDSGTRWRRTWRISREA